MAFGVADNRRTTSNRNLNVPTMGSLVSYGRVLKTVINPKDSSELYNANGEWMSIGGISFSWMSDFDATKSQDNPFAFPLLPNQNAYPVENEIVLIFILPNINATNKQDFSYYYLSPVAVWGASQVNSLPDNIYSDSTFQQKKSSYQEAFAGLPNNAGLNPTIAFANGFVEKDDIQLLTPLPGDQTIEGRWGNTIRFSNTNKTVTNPWSQAGNAGDPITIIRNGQGNLEKPNAATTFEDVNKDASSIYLTKSQKILLQSNRFDFTTYTQPQVLITSDRVSINSRTEDVIISAGKDIQMYSDNLTTNVTNETTLNSTKINLGSNTNTQSAVLGEVLVNKLSTLISNLSTLCLSLQSNPYLSPNSLAITLTKENLDALKSTLDQTLSDSVKLTP